MVARSLATAPPHPPLPSSGRADYSPMKMSMLMTTKSTDSAIVNW